MDFKLVSDYKPTGDQPEAIAELVRSINGHSRHNTLLGVTGSGKTFTIANVIAQLKRPTLVLSHNKTLAAQLYGEFKSFFPENAVEYFVSYYDYYQPEAYLPASDTYIEKDLSINEEIEKLRLRTTASLLSGRRDIVVVSSVSCLYGIGNPEDFHASSVKLTAGEAPGRKKILYALVDALYTRTEAELQSGTFRVNGEVIDVMSAYSDSVYRISMFDDEVEQIARIDPASGQVLERLDTVTIFPANMFVTTRERTNRAIQQIQLDLGERIRFFEEAGRMMEAQRIKQRVEYDLEMIKELGYCSGIENYSRYLDGRKEGTRPFCLLDYFPEDYLLVIDESHVTIPQIRAMYGGDRARKESLVEYGFRLPAAKDNRPLTFSEFEALAGTSIYVSATPADYELTKSEGAIVEQLIRPTGLVDPPISVRPTENQIDDLVDEIQLRAGEGRAGTRHHADQAHGRRAVEVFRPYRHPQPVHPFGSGDARTHPDSRRPAGRFVRCAHRRELAARGARPSGGIARGHHGCGQGGIPAQRQGLDADSGRAARNVNGQVIMYADRRTEAMQLAISESNRRREKQLRYNEEHGLVPRQAQKSGKAGNDLLLNLAESDSSPYPMASGFAIAADINESYSAMSLPEAIADARAKMEKAAAELDFIAAAKYRNHMYSLQEKLRVEQEVSGKKTKTVRG